MKVSNEDVMKVITQEDEGFKGAMAHAEELLHFKPQSDINWEKDLKNFKKQRLKERLLLINK